MLAVVLAFGAAALVAGGALGGLAFAAARRDAGNDERLADAIDAELPQLQCGDCGYAGCKPYALAVARGEVSIRLCAPGGEDTLRRIAGIVGEDCTPPVPLPATAPHPDPPPHAGEGEDDDRLTGTRGRAGDPATAPHPSPPPHAGDPLPNPPPQAGEGVKVAFIRREDCVGCALCLPVCPTDAIVGAAQMEHSVLAKDCTGCELCLPVCPVDCIEMHPAARTPLAQMRGGLLTPPPRHSHASGSPPPQPSPASGRGSQTTDCIRCGWCEEVCPVGLSPLRLHLSALNDNAREAGNLRLQDCIHCRRCDDACPSGIGLSAQFAAAKQGIAKTARNKAEAARLKTRYEGHLKRQAPPPRARINPAALAAEAEKGVDG